MRAKPRILDLEVEEDGDSHVHLPFFGLLGMQTINVRPLAAALIGPSACFSCRRAGWDLYRQPGLRPLHASPIFQRPRRRDFFSSNAALSTQKDPDSQNTQPGTIQKRKTARPSAAKTSLRRVAVEAQRSKVGHSVKTQQQQQEDVEAPKLVTAYAVAETFDIPKVVEILRSKGYEPDPLNTGLHPQVVHVQVPVSSIYRSSNVSVSELEAQEVGDVFIFPSGTLVTWALPEGFTSYFATRTLAPAATNHHPEPIETEDLDFIEDPSRETSTIRGDTIVLGTKALNTDNESNAHGIDATLTKIAFSSGFARSTKLAVLETNLSTYLASTASIPPLLSKGSRLPLRFSRGFILRKTGQLLELRAQLNLYSELTDSLPDLFWDSKYELNLENYYDQVGRALDVEVGFEVLRLYREGFWSEVWERGLKTDQAS
ncbi:uncharacterized protein AB675_10482 [Cyphellophora attinorum]|uniref:DUF155 domain-containing protein n=1 Tax=Cyphellophora attinorum TaxID=1664694 RepID=A0A0N0NIV8_9EURO|nr:uncharacterized protein AB675_10482 [Phialophora attinorum]KPI35899.1 hypothetical protein AB675_10482 [Phialophora attinorum]